ncbi:MAG TPA: 5-amino-6-(D-ribitylamino)uracil--L-tyrosine 4-hydroxyphenyl transferase CofH [Candidatus Nitrosotalea sp.]|nr:5-amino-6-(D-ribitylamino)uracil--L-tyrosine 4-hydroxyphenyl transferase CofH [Candidatus Nitrosotalea sp.]
MTYLALVDSLFKYADPLIADTLDRALSEKEISITEATRLFSTTGLDFHLVTMVADELRRRRVGDIVTYVINRNINFTNVCIKQCGFCAFSRDFREEEGYFLPIDEIVKRAREARIFGATEVCVQAGLPPDMDGYIYENICKAIKKEISDIHIHGFSPEEVLYGATRSNASIEDYLHRLKEAGVNSLPGTAAEILDQPLRDKISPGRITVKKWIEVIKTAHRIGIPSTSTMMFGHLETPEDRARHIGIIRDIQKETGGFTEFVPLNFIHSEAPMFKEKLHNGLKDGADGRDVILTHAISRIMLNNYINNIQTSWVKEGVNMSQLLLTCGANDFGGTLINESISTAAGAKYGQLIRPGEIRRLVRQIGRIPAQRTTSYKIIKMFDSDKEEDVLDTIDDVARFGSYQELIKLDKYRFKSNRRD